MMRTNTVILLMVCACGTEPQFVEVCPNRWLLDHTGLVNTEEFCFIANAVDPEGSTYAEVDYCSAYDWCPPSSGKLAEDLTLVAVYNDDQAACLARSSFAHEEMHRRLAKDHDDQDVDHNDEEWSELPGILRAAIEMYC